MKRTCVLYAIIIMSVSLIPSQALAQNSRGDYCENHPELFDSNGRLTLEAHKNFYLREDQGWWFDSNTKEWKEWPSKKATHTLEEHKNLYLGGPEWWNDSNLREWKEWPKRQYEETLDCHKKLHINGPDWWYDSNLNEWKPWPN